jgi:hypothetical protein
MAKFYAEIQGAKGPASRLGHHHIRSTTKSWDGEINVMMSVGPAPDNHIFVRVTACDHGGDNPVVLYSGRVGAWRTLGPLGLAAITAYREALEGRTEMAA